MNSQSFYPQYQPDQQQQFLGNPMVQNQFMQQFQQFIQPSYENHQFQNEFPRANDYNDVKQIGATFEHLKEVNVQQYDRNMKQARFFVLRSSNDDDIHKAIKYNIWTSTPNNNIILDKVFKESQQNNSDIYLFFSVVKSGQFIGVAKMASNFINKKFQFWWQNHKFNQQFGLKWVYIKDISYNLLNGINNMFNLSFFSDENSITRSKDCTEVDFENGKKVLEIFNNANAKLSIFQDFQFMDMREDMLRSHINMVRQQKQQGQENL